MKSLWVRAILPLLVTSLVVACGSNSDDSGDPVTRGSTPDPAAPVVTQEPPKQGAELELPKDGKTDSTKPNLNGEGEEGTGEGEGTDDQGLLDEGGEGSGGEQKIVNTTNEAYTGASNDYLRTYLTEQLNQTTGKSKARNQELADSIESARARVDQATGKALVTIQFRGEKSEVQFVGPMGRDGIATTTSAQRQNTEVDMVCADAVLKHCYTSILYIRTSGRSEASGYVLIRHTNADASFEVPKSRNGTNEFLKLLDLFANTKDFTGRKNSLKTILVESFEVIGGASGVKVALLSNEQELITASGPLVELDERLDGGVVAMNREMKLDDLIDLEKGRSFKTGMHDSISNVEMLKNDGRGNFTLRFTVSGNTKRPTRTLVVNIHRKGERVLTMEDLNSLFTN